ncbi:MAG: hypothetical protein ACREMZ_11010 [Gemmatimonadales bacterium]
MTSPRNLSLVVTMALTSVAGLTGQEPDTGGEDRVTQAPGPQYRAGGLHRLLLGGEYRSVWTKPASVPVLNLRSFAGGLRPVSRGGGQQTKSLLLAAADGREFFFRSIDKDPSAALPPELRGAVASQIVRDQTSSAFPTAPLLVSRLLEAAGILHGRAQLYVLPRSALLGEFQEEFGGIMGFLEDRIGGPRGPAAHWGGAAEIMGSDTLFARVRRSPDDRVDALSLLKARLFDVLIGDWDRHSDQWVWARFNDSIPRRWVPIPRDRDQAFAKYDGVLLYLARQSAPQLTNFGSGYPYMAGATWNGRDLDRRFLVELEWPVWDSIAREFQAALTDSVIHDAVRALPEEHYTVSGAELTAALRSRRDRLVDAAREYYRLLAHQVEVHASDAADEARLTRQPGGGVELTLSRRHAAPGSGDPYFRRRFDPRATEEIRLFMDGGDDRVVARGNGDGPLLRILGGPGQDQLIDSTGGGGLRLYDDPDAPERAAVSGARVDRRPYAAPHNNPDALPPRDWGQRWKASIWASGGPDVGVLLGTGQTLTVYGFRKQPFALRHRFRAGFATGPRSYRLDYRGEFRREGSAAYAEILVRASGIDVISFHGFGNQISAPGTNEFYRVTQDAFGLLPSVVIPLGSRGAMQVGPVLKYASTDERPGRFLATLGGLYGAGNFGELGGALTAWFDSRDRPNGASRGVVLEVGTSVYPGVWDVDSMFGEVHGQIATYLTAPIPLQPTLAVRLGGRKLWGRFPFFEAAFIGGASTVRLGRVNRYAGDASAYGSAEIRLPLARVDLVVPAELGVFGLADAGRVFLEGESSDRWHTAAGGGVSLSFLNRANTISAAVARGEERTGVYVQAGFGF